MALTNPTPPSLTFQKLVIGQSLVVDPGEFDGGTAPLGTEWEWFRSDDADGTNRAAITTPAIGVSPLPLNAADHGKFIDAEVTAFDSTPTVAASYVSPDTKLHFSAVAGLPDAGNDVSITLADPGANDAVLSVDVTGSDVTVNLATDGTGTITSTTGDVLAAINAEPTAVALLTPSAPEGPPFASVVAAFPKANLSGGSVPETLTVTTDPVGPVGAVPAEGTDLARRVFRGRSR